MIRDQIYKIFIVVQLLSVHAQATNTQYAKDNQKIYRAVQQRLELRLPDGSLDETLYIMFAAQILGNSVTLEHLYLWSTGSATLSKRQAGSNKRYLEYSARAEEFIHNFKENFLGKSGRFLEIFVEDQPLPWFNFLTSRISGRLVIDLETDEFYVETSDSLQGQTRWHNFSLSSPPQAKTVKSSLWKSMLNLCNVFLQK